MTTGISLDDETKVKVEALMQQMGPLFNGQEGFVVYAALAIMLGRACGLSDDPQKAAIRAVHALGLMTGVPVIAEDEEEEEHDECRQQSIN